MPVHYTNGVIRLEPTSLDVAGTYTYQLITYNQDVAQESVQTLQFIIIESTEFDITINPFSLVASQNSIDFVAKSKELFGFDDLVQFISDGRYIRITVEEIGGRKLFDEKQIDFETPELIESWSAEGDDSNIYGEWTITHQVCKDASQCTD